jgi:MOSC domain-containing protein YiiM
MRLISINIAQPQPMYGTERGTVMSGIHKAPIARPAAVRRLGIEGDGVGDTVNHGGELKAIYVYDADDYSYWREHGLAIPHYGWFGENFTVEGARSDEVCLGDVWRAGEVLLQVSEPRTPCYKLEHKIGIPRFAATFQRSGRLGFYLRVLEPGEVEAGTPVTHVSRPDNPITVRQLAEFRRHGKGGLDMARRALALENVGREWQRRARKVLAPAGDARL